MGDRWHPKPWQERFWAKVDRQSPARCWPWLASLGAEGYGQFSTHDPAMTTRYTHRIAWVLTNGPVPEGMELDHLCRNRRCCNPAHLEVVTHRVNIHRGTGPISELARQTHCKRGHPLAGDNLLITVRKDHRARRCRACAREARRVFDEKHGGSAAYAREWRRRRKAGLTRSTT